MAASKVNGDYLMSSKLLIADPKKCVGCKLCQIACSLKKNGVSNPGKSRIRIINHNYQNIYVPVSCRHCEDAPCMAVCPKEAIYRDEKLERVMIDYDKCISCRTCVAACPYGAVVFDAEKKRVAKCDLCDGEPECIHFCEANALDFVDQTLLQYPRIRETALKFTGRKQIAAR